MNNSKTDPIDLDALERRVDDTLNLGGYVGHLELHALIAELRAARKALIEIMGTFEQVDMDQATGAFFRMGIEDFNRAFAALTAYEEATRG